MLSKFNHDATVSWILKAAVGTLAIITVIVIAVLAVSLFWEGFDRQAILGILGPVINTIIGAFVGLLGGLTLNGNGIKDPATRLNSHKDNQPVENNT
jgi:uncharacterized membrane protein